VEGGKFIIAVLLAIVLAGGAYYMNSKEIDELRTQVAASQGKIAPIQTNAVNAGLLAKDAKATADAAKADAAKANDAITALTATVTEMQKPAPAKKK
jgi:uncharacterized protein HemX